MGLGALVGTGITGVVDAVAGAGTAEAIGAAAGLSAGELGTATALGSAVEGAGIGAGLGAGESALTGGNPLTGAITGGISGGALGGVGGVGGLVDSATGLGAVGSDALVGAGSGALGSAITGGDPLTGAVTGAAEGGLAGALSGSGTADTTSAFGGAASDASNALTYNFGPADAATGSGATTGGTFSGGGAAPTLAGGAGITAADAAPQITLANLGGVAAGAGPAAAAFAPPAGIPGGVAVDPTSTVNLGVDVSGAPGANFNVGAPDLSGGIPADITQGAGGVVGQDPGNLPVPPVPPDGGAPGLLSQIGGDISSGVKSVGDFASGPWGKALGLGVSGLGLAKNLLTPSSIPGLAGLESQAASQAATGNQLIQSGIANTAAPTAAATSLAGSAAGQGATLSNYLNSGTLPPGVQTAIDQATQDAITGIKGQYASRGMSGSSAELQDIQRVQNQAISQGATIATGLLNSGISLEQLSSQVYNSLIGQGNSLIQTGASLSGTSGQTLNAVINQNVASNNQVNSAISNLATALSGGTKITLNGTQAAA